MSKKLGKADMALVTRGVIRDPELVEVAVREGRHPMSRAQRRANSLADFRKDAGPSRNRSGDPSLDVAIKRIRRMGKKGG